MSARKLPDTFVEDPYVKGYLHQRLEGGDVPAYSYEPNHLPATTGKRRSVESCFDIAVRQNSSG